MEAPDKSRTIVTLNGETMRWVEGWNCWADINGKPVYYLNDRMKELLCGDYARYRKASQPKPKSKQNLRARILNGVG